MRREEMEQLLVGYLYGELEPDERAEVERELDRNPEWAEILEELRSTTGILRQWEDEEPAVRHLLAASPAPATGGRSARPARPRRRFSALASVAAGVAAAALLIVLNTEVGVEDGRMRISFGRAPRETAEPAVGGSVPLELGTTVSAPAGGPYLSEEDFLRSQAELVRFVATLIRDSEERQADKFMNTLAEYARELQEKREGDLVTMDRRLNVVEEDAGVAPMSVPTEPSRRTVPTEGGSSR